MNRQQRQERIAAMLQDSRQPWRGEDIAQALDVTRQVVVHEIALLRASGLPIVSTPRGYVIYGDQPSPLRTVISVRHTADQTAEELYTLVDAGVTIENVIVEHPLYGELKGSLNLRSRLDVDTFLADVHAGGASLLSSLTDGHHLHTVSYPRVESLTYAVARLRERDITVLD